MKRYALMIAALVALACLGSPASAQVPGGLMRFGTNGAFAPQAGNCLSILAMNSSGQTATDSAAPCFATYLPTAYTNATTGYTAVLTLPTVQGNTVLRGECTLTYAVSSTSGTATFAMGASAAPTNLWVTGAPTTGVLVVPTFATITTTATTAVTGALVTTTAAATYQVYLSFMLVNGAAPNTLTVYAESNNASYTVTVEPGSSCQWIP
jgi:hypothetical protein